MIGLNLNNDPSFHSAYEMIDTKIRKAIRDNKPDLIGMGGICIDYKFLKDAISICRQEDPKIPIVLGGGIVTNDAEFISKTLKPDCAVIGEADDAIVGLIKYLGHTNMMPRIVEASTPNLDPLPFPDYEPFGIQDMLDNYSMSTRLLYRYSRPYARPFTIVASRGCPFRCTFCVHQGGRGKYHARSISNIIEEIKVTYEKYRYNILIIVDELFAVDKKRMRDFCEHLLENKKRYDWDFDWMFQTHANAKLDKDTLDLAKQSGCYFFSYGIESASPAVLKSMNKHTKVPQIVEAIKLAHEANLGFGGNLIFGDPAENDQTISESTDFFLRYGRDVMIFPGFLMPYPGSELFDQCVERGIIEDKLDYYETIDRRRYNMTSMSFNEWIAWSNFIEKIAQYWWNVEECEATKVEADSIGDAFNRYYKLSYQLVTANCPYCGTEIKYRNLIPPGKSMLGVGCTKCNRKIKVNVGEIRK